MQYHGYMNMKRIFSLFYFVIKSCVQFRNISLRHVSTPCSVRELFPHFNLCRNNVVLREKKNGFNCGRSTKNIMIEKQSKL